MSGADCWKGNKRDEGRISGTRVRLIGYRIRLNMGRFFIFLVLLPSFVFELSKIRGQRSEMRSLLILN